MDFTRRSRRGKMLELLRSHWGRPGPEKALSPENARFFEKAESNQVQERSLDARTWADLDMDLVYSRLDRTLTIPGERVLYSLLRTPCSSPAPLERRGAAAGYFLGNQDVRERVQIILSKLGKRGGGFVADLLWGERPAPAKRAYGYLMTPCLVPAFIVWGLLVGLPGWIAFGILSVGHGVIHYRNKRRFVEDLPSIRYLGRMVTCAERLSRLPDLFAGIDRQRLRSDLKKVSRLAPDTALLNLGENNALYEYLNILFLVEVRAFRSYLRLTARYENELRTIFNTIGFLDATQSVASYRAGLEVSCVPDFNGSAASLDLAGAVHPLVSGPVPNSLRLEKGGVLVTGSNMSGKTTFLKTIGVNLVLAQTLNFCLATRLRSSLFNVLTLIGRSDNLIEGKSYYLDEITSLLRMVRAAQRGAPCLCLIDELFRGTNSAERICASTEVLLYLAKKNALVCASTHDMELTRLVSGAFVNYHFEENIGERGLSFNYQLREGPSESRSAIRLLGHVGFPEEITEAAEARIRGSR